MTPLRKITIGLTALGSLAVGALGISTISTANAASASSGVVAVTADTTAPVASADSSGTVSSSTASTDAAATPTADSATPPADAATPPAGDHGQGAPHGPHVANGITETVLAGDTATSAEAAVKAKYPDATIERMETDAEGAVYEAHITKADGSHATVKLDANFAVTDTLSGHG